jgi:hypothetical protein
MAENSGGYWQGPLRLARRLMVVLAVAIALSAMFLGLEILQGDDVEPVDVVITGVLGLAVASYALWLGRRGQAKDRTLPAGSPTGTNIARAISTGRLPKQASAEEWEAELIWILIRERHMVWIGPLVCGLFAALGVFLALAMPEHPWFGVLFAATSSGMALWFPILIRRRRVRIQALIDQFTDEESSKP